MFQRAGFFGVRQAEILPDRREDDAGDNRQVAVGEKVECQGFRPRCRLGFRRGLLLAVVEIDPPHEAGAEECAAEHDKGHVIRHVLRRIAAGGQDRFAEADDHEQRAALRHVGAGHMERLVMRFADERHVVSEGW